MWFLAQSFPDPPLLEQWLFINPWPGVIVLVAVAAVLRLMAQRSAKPRLNIAAVTALALALALYLTTALVTTPREQVDRAMRSLLRATAEADFASITAMIDPSASITDPDGNTAWGTRSLHDELPAALQRFPIDFHRVNDLRVAPRGDRRADVMLDLRTTFKSQGLPNATRWVFTWERAEGDAAWRVTEARWLQWQGQRPPGAVWR